MGGSPCLGPLGTVQRALIHAPLHLKPVWPKWEARGRSGPGVGRPRAGGERHFPAAASAEAPSALRFGKSLFSSAGRAGVSVLKTRTKIHWLVFPAGAALAPPPGAARLPGMPNLQHFRAWLNYLSVIWCRGRSRPDSHLSSQPVAAFLSRFPLRLPPHIFPPVSST